jgi:transcriptional regulator with XRE-family HTH domain
VANRIRAARRDRDWSQTRLIAELERVAKRRNVTLPTRETLKSRVSRWENGHAKPDDFYRQLLREALGMDDRELGWDMGATDESIAVAAAELQMHLATAQRVDGALVGALRSQTEAIRLQDRQYGAGLLLEQMRGHVQNLERHLSHTVFEGARKPLAQLLADAAALAAWQALDVGAVEQAWRSFETATAASRQAEDPALYAFARLEQAHVLTELGQASTAADLAECVWREVGVATAPAMRCWMAAATAEMLAGDCRREEALAMILRAEGDADRLAERDKPPYLVFNQTHLERWIGHTLVELRDPSGEDRLRRVSAEMDGSFVRASASLTLDLAAAVQQRGEQTETSLLLSKGEALAHKVGSRRLLRRAQKLRAAS